MLSQSNVITLYPQADAVPAGRSGFVSTASSQSLWLFDRESFRHAQKMEAMGRLTAGVAHDFYNILTVIQGYAALLGRGQRTPKELNEQLNHISAAANRGAILTRQLLSYSRRDPLQFEPLDLSGLINNLSNMLNRLLGEEVVLQTSCSATLKPILGDRGMIEQLVVNLIVNARDAIAERGKIALTTDAIQITRTHVERHRRGVLAAEDAPDRRRVVHRGEANAPLDRARP